MQISPCFGNTTYATPGQDPRHIQQRQQLADGLAELLPNALQAAKKSFDSQQYGADSRRAFSTAASNTISNYIALTNPFRAL